MAQRNKEKREYAHHLYLKGEYQKSIAQKVGVSEKTISKWKDEDGWDQSKAATFMSKEQQIVFIYDQINEINTYIRDRETGKRFANSKEADALMKLTKAAKELEGELGLSEVINVGMDFLSFLKPIDHQAALLLHNYWDRYVKSKMPK